MSASGRPAQRDALALALGRYIHAHRTTARISRAELALRVGVSRQAIHLWESGDSMPSWGSLYDLAACFGVEASELMPTHREVR